MHMPTLAEFTVYLSALYLGWWGIYCEITGSRLQLLGKVLMKAVPVLLAILLIGVGQGSIQ